MEEFILAVKAASNKKIITSVGKVVEIQGNTCTVERDGLSTLIDVRLDAVAGDFKSHFTVFPSIGSKVLVLEVENKPAETTIVKYTEIDRVKINIENFVFDADKKGLELTSQGENLKTVIGDLIDELNKILVVQGNTINVPAMNKIKQRFNKILK